jgi:uncharacterized protein YndB with AHSA1/START domain
MTTENISDREFIFTRLLNAPRELVWEVWTDPKHIVNWWGPNGFTNTNQEMNVKTGGIWRFVMHGPDGRNYPNKIVYLEVVKLERLVYKHESDENTEPVDFNVTVTFEKQGEKTLITMRMLFPTVEDLKRIEKEYGAYEGGIQNLNRLEKYLARRK